MNLRTPFLAIVATLALSAGVHAQTKPINPAIPPPPPPAEEAKPKPDPGIDPSIPPAPPPAEEEAAAPENQIDPIRAKKSLNVGEYYYKKGNYPAALDRFQDAARMYPGYALPYMRIGETYEKLGQLPEAVKAYRQYLRLYVHAPTKEKLLEHIEELTRQQEVAEKKRSGN
ncbi:MAG: tetratricopeptide repeat protein [Bryobacteraceae bacterium]